MGAVRNRAANHFQDVLSRINRKQECRQVGARSRRRRQRSRGRNEMAGMGECLVVFPLQVGLSDLQVLKGHLGAGVAEQLHECGKADAGAEHFCGVGVAPIPAPE